MHGFTTLCCVFEKLTLFTATKGKFLKMLCNVFNMHKKLRTNYHTRLLHCAAFFEELTLVTTTKVKMHLKVFNTCIKTKAELPHFVCECVYRIVLHCFVCNAMQKNAFVNGMWEFTWKELEQKCVCFQIELERFIFMVSIWFESVEAKLMIIWTLRNEWRKIK